MNSNARFSIILINFEFVQARTNVAKNARLSDICIGTSAAPTYLPAHYFETRDASGKTRSFDLIDGGVAANNPVSSFKKELSIFCGASFANWITPSVLSVGNK